MKLKSKLFLSIGLTLASNSVFAYYSYDEQKFIQTQNKAYSGDVDAMIDLGKTYDPECSDGYSNNFSETSCYIDYFDSHLRNHPKDIYKKYLISIFVACLILVGTSYYFFSKPTNTEIEQRIRMWNQSKTFDEIFDAALKGDQYAQTSLAMKLENRKLYREAVNWYEKAAKQGNPVAQYLIGLIYYNGKLGEKNYFQAFDWFSQSAQQNYAIGALFVGVMYEDGQAVKQDKKRAKEFYGKSCDFGEQAGCEFYQMLNEEGL